MTLHTPERLWAAIHAERTRLADDLTGLTDAQWAHPTLCADWTVEDVVAHLTAAATTGRWAWLRSIAGARFRPDVHNARRLAEHRGPTPAATLAAFRAVVDARVAPTGDLWAWLGEVVVHAADVREPLGIATAPEPDAVLAVAEGYVRKDFAVDSRTRARGLLLVATDSGFVSGAGLGVEGTTLDLVLALAGRAAVLPRLTGDGVGTLAGRIGG
ncbi:maleylpyruvate isomerase family mycothiol-dependent enzyme [Cellulomonas sp. HD19AZ1]|uniref:maleylpyruvate isomerase family mycothiol-dependent enzyme n=1 Tax=Cellulomonas TaxID=1707 RepID=UPI001070F412|nr:maleylpyruvate isomerase family mycothiol-dependent enzyme [Cellulomonas sp. HD19AZ1]TFH72126.1 maleylpyruvate isomerase family mycothiol-dependent enzyme [Cellulomonas sp. HD19AZ1]